MARGCGVSSVTARERAIEAGLKAAEDDPRWKFDIYPTGWAEVEDIVTIAAPFIESALLDRIEEAVKEKRDVAQRLREAAGKGSLVDWTEATRMDTLDAVLAILTEIREGQS